MLASEISLFPDRTFFIQLAIFLAVLACLNHLVFRPVLQILRLRMAKTDGDRKKIAEIKEKTETLLQEYSKKIQEAKQEAFQMKEAIRRTGEEQGQKIVQEAKQASLAQIEKTKKEMEGITQACAKELEAHAQSLGRQIAEKVLGRPLSH